MTDEWVLPPRDWGRLDRLDLKSLVGMTVSQARAAVTQVGGVLREVDETGAMTLDYRRDRVTVMVDSVGHVIKTLGRY